MALASACTVILLVGIHTRTSPKGYDEAQSVRGTALEF